MFSKRVQFIGAALLGAFVIHFCFVACSGVEQNAHAQSPPCGSWQVQVVAPTTVRYADIPISGTTPTQTLTFDPFTTPAGWEPIGTYAGDGILLRRCADQ